LETHTELNIKAHFYLTGDDGVCFDADGKERIGRIIAACYEFCKVNESPAGKYPHEYALSTNSRGHSAWCARFDSAWQVDIEEHVRAYREPAPDYAGDIGEAMKLLWPNIHNLDGGLSVYQNLRLSSQGKPSWVMLTHYPSGEVIGNFGEFCDTAAEAITQAYIAACEAKP